MIRSLIIGLTLLGLAEPLLAQEDMFKDYAESHYERKYCLYPSTLRMINIKQNEDFNELASSFEKFLIYQLDSMSIAQKSYSKMISGFRNEGYEEYVTIFGGGNSTVILGKEMRVNELVGVVGLDDQLFAFFVKGNIAWQKIPTMINTLKDDDLFNVLDIKSERRRN